MLYQIKLSLIMTKISIPDPKGIYFFLSCVFEQGPEVVTGPALVVLITTEWCTSGKSIRDL